LAASTRLIHSASFHSAIHPPPEISNTFFGRMDEPTRTVFGRALYAVHIDGSCHWTAMPGHHKHRLPLAGLGIALRSSVDGAQ
jgi:hypothetical protein